jgi:hypothetical protein
MIYHSIQPPNTIASVRTPMSQSLLRRRLLLIASALVLSCFALSPPARAVSPAPDGGYPGENTAEGDFALNSLSSVTTGGENTAIGWSALFNDTGGNDNTASGAFALATNSTGLDNTATGFGALDSNTSASSNTATGFEALFNNNPNNSSGGYSLTATGAFALFRNTTGSRTARSRNKGTRSRNRKRLSLS